MGPEGTREVKEMQKERQDQKRDKGTSQASHWATLVPVEQVAWT